MSERYIVGSKSTQAGYESAEAKIVLIQEYLGLRGQFVEACVTRNFFDNVAKFFIEYYTIPTGKNKNQRLSVASIMQYVSGIYNILSKRYPTLSLFTDDREWNLRLHTSTPKWYSEFRAKLENRLIRDIQEKGEKLQDKSLAIGPKMATDIGKNLLRNNGKEDILMSNVNTNCHMNGGR